MARSGTGARPARGGSSPPERVRQPVFDGAIRIGVAHVARRQLLQGGRQHAHAHEFRLKGSHTRVQAPPSSALDRMASTRRLARKPSSNVATIGAIGGYGAPAAMV